MTNRTELLCSNTNRNRERKNKNMEGHLSFLHTIKKKKKVLCQMKHLFPISYNFLFSICSSFRSVAPFFSLLSLHIDSSFFAVFLWLFICPFCICPNFSFHSRIFFLLFVKVISKWCIRPLVLRKWPPIEGSRAPFFNFFFYSNFYLHTI